MKRLLAVSLLAVLLLCGCQGRGEPSQPSSSQESSSSMAEELPRTPLEQALDENLASAFPTGSNWENLKALGITAQVGKAEIVNETMFRYPVTVQNSSGGSVTLTCNGIYQAGDMEGNPGENLRLTICGFAPGPEGKLLFADAYEAKLLDIAHLDGEPQVLTKLQPGESSGSIVDAAYHPQGGYLVLTVDAAGKVNTLFAYDGKGTSSGSVSLENPEGYEHARFDRDCRLSRVNDCAFLPMGQMQYLPMENPAWVLENQTIWRVGGGSQQQDCVHFLTWEGDGCRVELYSLNSSGNAGEVLARWVHGEDVRGFFFDGSNLDFNLLVFGVEKDWITHAEVDPSAARVKLEAGDLGMTLDLDFAAQTAQLDYQYTTADLKDGWEFCQSPSQNRAVYGVSGSGMGDAAWGNFAVYDKQQGTVQFLAPYSNVDTALFCGEDRILIRRASSLEMYDAATAQRLDLPFAIPADGEGNSQWAVSVIWDGQNQLLLALCRQGGYDFDYDALLPTSLVVYSPEGEIVRQVSTGIEIPAVYKNFFYAPSLQLDGKGNLILRGWNEELLGTIPYLQ